MKKLFAASLLSLAVAAPASALTNESFENGLTGWAVIGSVAVSNALTVGATAVTAKSGNYFALLTTDGYAPELLYQTSSVPTTQSQTLWYRFLSQDSLPYNDNLTIQYKLQGNANAITIDTLSIANSGSDSGWKSFVLPQSVVFIKAQLQNLGSAVGVSYAAIDIAPTSVIVPPTDIKPAIPEPETYGMLLAGLALIGTVIRRRTRQS